jgi:hypothetical protein
MSMKENTATAAIMIAMARSVRWTTPARHQLPVLGIDFQGSAGASGAPFCSSSIEMLSGERTNAICPSRGGLRIVTPWAASCAQVAYRSCTS